MKRILTPLIFVVVVIIIWEILFRLQIWPSLIFPSIGSILTALLRAFTKDEVYTMVAYSIKLIGKGLFLGVGFAIVFSCLSILFTLFYHIYNMLVSLFDLIPGVALIPLAILWLGVGEASIIFIVVHSVIWPMSRSIIDGFKSVPKLYIEVGKNLGFNKFHQIFGVYIPATSPQIISGIRVGWARAWRGLISAEMIFGTTSVGAGIGWYIMMKRVNVDIAGVFAAIIIIVCIGCIVEYAVFRNIEKQTIHKWGMTTK